MPTDEDDLDVVLDILAAAERRHAIRVLRTVEAPIATADLAREIAGRETTSAGDEDPLDAAEGLQTTLFHSHLPKLAAADVVEFGDDRNTVAPGGGFEAAAAVLRSIDESAAVE